MTFKVEVASLLAKISWCCQATSGDQTYCFISPENKNLSLKIGTKSFKEDWGGKAACTFQRSDSRQEDFLRTCFLSAASGAALRGEAWKSAGLSLCCRRGGHCEDTTERIFQCDTRPPSSSARFLLVQHLRHLQAEVWSSCGRSHLRLLHSHWWLEASPWCRWPEREDKENDHNDDDGRVFQTRIKSSRFSCLSPSTGPSAGALPLWPTGRAPALRTASGTLPPPYSPRWRLSSGLWYPTVTERGAISAQ